MSKVGNFTRETLKNGAKVCGGHRVKYVSKDKDFVILLTSYGYYYGIYLNYESDGAHVDPERTPRQSKELCFNTLEECMKHFKVGEFSEQEKEEKAEVVSIEQPNSRKQFEDFKQKHPESILLFNKGEFYECYDEDAEKVSKEISVALTTKGKEKLAMFPRHCLDVVLPKLVRAGHKVAIVDHLEDPKLTKKLNKITEKYEAPAEAPIECKGMEAMREAFIKLCDDKKIEIDKTCIKQAKEDTSKGTLVGYKDKKQVLEIAWHREVDGKDKKYYLG